MAPCDHGARGLEGLMEERQVFGGLCFCRRDTDLGCASRGTCGLARVWRDCVTACGMDGVGPNRARDALSVGKQSSGPVQAGALGGGGCRHPLLIKGMNLLRLDKTTSVFLPGNLQPSPDTSPTQRVISWSPSALCGALPWPCACALRSCFGSTCPLQLVPGVRVEPLHPSQSHGGFWSSLSA